MKVFTNYTDRYIQEMQNESLVSGDKNEYPNSKLRYRIANNALSKDPHKMKITKNTILITEGTSGIGFEIAKLFAKNGNTVIVTGRDKSQLQRTAIELTEITPVVCDIANAGHVDDLLLKMEKHFPSLNMVVNAATKTASGDISPRDGAFEKAAEEINTNYLSVVRLNERLIALLKEQKDAAIVNISQTAQSEPDCMNWTYLASIAALHSYTQSLREVLSRNSNIKVFELGGAFANVTLAEQLMSALSKDQFEIHIGKTAYIYEHSQHNEGKHYHK